MDNQASNFSTIQTMTASYTAWSEEAISPFICNLEFNKSAQLERRRGTTLLYDIKESDPDYARTLAVGYVKIRTTGFSFGNNTVIDIGIVAYLSGKTTTNVKYYVFTLPNTLTIQQSPFSISESDIVKYSPYPSYQLGLQTMTLPLEDNIFYVLLNLEDTGSIPNGFNIVKFTITPDINNAIGIISVFPNSGIEGEFGMGKIPPAIRRKSTQRAITSGVNRLFVGESNILYYNLKINIDGTVKKLLDQYAIFKDTDVIVKVIEFDNFIFVITNQAVYKGSINETGVIIFSTISNNVIALNSPSILIVGNFCYIPTLDGSIYKLNLKGNNIEIDSYSDKIGEQTIALVESSYPRQTYYDSFNSTINFVYAGNMYAPTSMLNKYSSPLINRGGGIQTTLQSIILSKHYLAGSGAPESWTSLILENEDVAGGMNFTTRISSVFTPTQNTYINESLNELSLTEEPLTKYDYSTEAINEYMSHTILVHDSGSGKIVLMNIRSRLDLGTPFKVAVCCPMITSNIIAIETQKRYNARVFEALITTDESQSTEMYPNAELEKTNIIMTSYVLQFTGDLSKEIPLAQKTESMLLSQDKSVIMHIKVILDTHLPNSGVLCIFKSNDIRTFIGFRVTP